MCSEFQGELDYIPPTQTGGRWSSVLRGRELWQHLTAVTHAALRHSAPLHAIGHWKRAVPTEVRGRERRPRPPPLGSPALGSSSNRWMNIKARPEHLCHFSWLAISGFWFVWSCWKFAKRHLPPSYFPFALVRDAQLVPYSLALRRQLWWTASVMPCHEPYKSFSGVKTQGTSRSFIRFAQISLL